MIRRIWHGWTTEENADTYERLLVQEVLPGIAAKQIAGYHGVEVLRRPVANGEVEFVTVMRFESLAAIEAFVGADSERAHVPDAARKVLSRFDARTQHYELRHQIDY